MMPLHFNARSRTAGSVILVGHA
jgi:3-oxoacyl-[acyl-carrier protein] reductase